MTDAHPFVKDLKAVGFDIDNTLYVQTKEIHSAIQDYIFQSAAKILGRNYADIKKDYEYIFESLQSGRRTLEKMGVKDGAKLVQDALEKTDIASILDKDERLMMMMNNLASKYNLFIISGSNEIEATRKLIALGLDTSIFSPKIYPEKKLYREDGSAFKYASLKLDVPLNQMMFVGDRESVDIIPAKSLGMITAIVNSISSEPTYQLNDIYSLENILMHK